MQGKPVFRHLLAIGFAATLGLTPLPALAQAPAPATPTPATPAPTTPAQPSPQSTTPAPPTAPATPDKAETPSATPAPKTPAASVTPAPAPGPSPNASSPKTPASPSAPGALAPGAAPRTDEVEPNRSPQTPTAASMETIQVSARPIAYVEGQSSYDDAFKSIKASLDKVRAAMDKAGLKPSGHPITIFVDTDDKGFKYKAAIPIAAKPEGKSDLGDGVALGESPAGSGLKFRHRGPFDEIDSTYDLIVAYLDEKGLQIDPPYIEEYLTDLTTPDDPKLEVDIYTFIKK